MKLKLQRKIENNFNPYLYNWYLKAGHFDSYCNIAYCRINDDACSSRSESWNECIKNKDKCKWLIDKGIIAKKPKKLKLTKKPKKLKLKKR